MAVKARFFKKFIFNKVKATVENVIVIFCTLWEYIVDLAVNAKTRIIFHVCHDDDVSHANAR